MGNSTPPGASLRSAYDEVRSLYDADGPVASVFLDTRPEGARLDEVLEVRWNNAERRLREAEAPDAAIEALEAAVRGVEPGAGDTFAAFAHDDGPLLHRSLPEPPTRDIVHVDGLAYAVPLLDWAQARLAHIVVLIDRVGADLVAFEGSDPLGRREMQGERLHVHRGHPGGWSQRRFQQRAENTWEQNAREVAHEVGDLARALDAAAIIVAGDVRARTFFVDHLPEDARDAIHQFEGSRAVDDPLADIADDTVRTMATIVASRTRDVIERFVEERGRGGLAVDGADATLGALAMGAVDLLLVHDDPDDERRAWFGPEPTDVGTAKSAIEARERPAREARLTDVAVRAALQSGAEVRVVPGSGPNAPNGGLGALLRFPVERAP